MGTQDVTGRNLNEEKVTSDHSEIHGHVHCTVEPADATALSGMTTSGRLSVVVTSPTSVGFYCTYKSTHSETSLN